MPVHRCPKCSIPYVDAEIEHGVCPGCNAPIVPPTELPSRNVPTAAPTAATAPRRSVPFLLGLLVGCLIGPAVLWEALRLGAPLPGDWIEQTVAFRAVRAQKTAADNQGAGVRGRSSGGRVRSRKGREGAGRGETAGHGHSEAEG